MKEKIIWKIFILSFIMTILSTIFLCIYYNVILKDHTGPMDLWAIIILLLSFIPLVVSIIMIYINKYKYTSGLERQRGEAFPPLPDFIDFLVSVLKQNGEINEK